MGDSSRDFTVCHGPEIDCRQREIMIYYKSIRR